MVRTKIERPKMARAGVESGEKMVVGHHGEDDPASLVIATSNHTLEPGMICVMAQFQSKSIIVFKGDEQPLPRSTR